MATNVSSPLPAGTNTSADTSIYQISGRIVIDTYSFNRYSRDRTRHLQELKPSDSMEMIEGTGREEEHGSLFNRRRSSAYLAHHLIYTPRLRGYGLKSKKWRMLQSFHSAIFISHRDLIDYSGLLR